MPVGLIVGAAGGVGRAVVAEMIGRGYDLWGTVMNQQQDDQLIADFPESLSTIQLDLANADLARERLSMALSTSGIRPDAVVICSGVAPFGPVETMPLAKLRSTLEINMVACVAVYQACIPALRETRGRLIFLSSMAGRVGLPFMGQYSASKFALEGIADVMRREAYRWGVRVSLIEPGGIRTSMMTDEIAQVRSVIAGLSAEERAREGAVYDQLLARMLGSFPNALDPATVARTVMDIIASDDPQARREIGDDAIRLCTIARVEGDHATDVAMRSAYGGALG